MRDGEMIRVVFLCMHHQLLLMGKSSINQTRGERGQEVTAGVNPEWPPINTLRTTATVGPSSKAVYQHLQRMSVLFSSYFFPRLQTPATMDFIHAICHFPGSSESGHNQRWLDVAMIYLRMRQIPLILSSPNGRSPHKTKTAPLLQEHLSLNLHLADV